MNHRLIVSAVFTLYFGGFIVPAVHGQSSTAARRNRAASQSASMRLGRVGGLNTGRYGDVQRLTNVSRGGLDPVGAGLTQPNYFGAGWQIGRLRQPALPQAFMLNRPGMRMQQTQSLWASALRGVQRRDIESASRLEASLRLTVPLTGIGSTAIRLPNRPYFVPEQTGTAFHDFFGLRPTEAEPVSDMPVPDEDWVGLLERQNEELFLQKKTEALATFKAATREGVENRYERLSEARWALRGVRDLLPEEHVPCLLLLHIALEKNQLQSAITYLEDVVKRHPAVFVERADIESYFGDPTLIEQTARRYLRIGDTSSSPEYYALQAYCAWVINDPVRLREALDRMMADDLEQQLTWRLDAVRHALSAAVK